MRSTLALPRALRATTFALALTALSACRDADPRPPTLFEDPNSFARLRDVATPPSDGTLVDREPIADARLDSTPMDSSDAQTDSADAGDSAAPDATTDDARDSAAIDATIDDASVEPDASRD
jgi:hypothetical protein